MTGKIYNSWRVASYSHTNKKITMWNCECLECNTFYKVDGRNLRQGLTKRCVPCGHLTGHAKQKGQERMKDSENALFRYIKYAYKKSANTRGIENTLNIEDVKGLVLKNCEYCNAAPERVSFPMRNNGVNKINSERSIVRNGIDRVDSNKGYVAGNVVACCTACNMAKMEMSTEQFKAWIVKVATHMGLFKP